MKHFKNDFKIGIELEAFASIEEYAPNFCSDYDDFLYCNILNSINYDDDDYEPLDEFYGNITRFFEKNYGFRGDTHYDGSVKGYDSGYNGFEWSSPIIDFTPSQINKLKKMLLSLKDDDFHINDTCGFHTHFSYNGINEEDVLWIMMHISLNQHYLKELTKFEFDERDLVETKHHCIDFFNGHYADKDFLTVLGEAIKCKQYDTISTYLSMEKYRVLRIHPQGTLEWRGPRGFLNSQEGIEAYIKKMYRVVGIFQEILEKETLLDMTRDEWFEKISEDVLVNGSFYNEVLPIRADKQKKNRSYGLLSDFQPNRATNRYTHKNKHKVWVNSPDMVTNQILRKPSIMNSSSVAHMLPEICYNLVGMGKLREIIERMVNEGIKPSVNVQYHMIQKNVTLLPYVTDDIWKYLPMSKLKTLIFRNGPFSQASDYKLKTVDFLIDKLPQVYDINTTISFWKWFFNSIHCSHSYKWLGEYIMTKLDKILDIFKEMESIAYSPNALKMIDEKVRKQDNFDSMWRFLMNIDSCACFNFEVEN